MKRFGRLLSKPDVSVQKPEEPRLVSNAEIRVELDPVETVEAALLFNAPLFEAVHAAWEQAVAKEKVSYATFNPFNDLGLGGMMLSAGQLNRQTTRQLSSIRSALFYDIRRYGATVGQQISADFLASEACSDPLPSDALFDASSTDMVNELTDEMRNQYHAAGVADLYKDNIAMIKLMTELAPLFAKAEMLTAVAKARFQGALTTPEACAYFIDRVAAMSEIGTRAEIPGLLELIATEDFANEKASIVSGALEKIDFSPPSQAVQFIDQIIDDTGSGAPENRYTKEVATAFALLRTVAKLFDTETATSESDFSERFASTIDTWPQPLVQALTQYAANARVRTSAATKNALAPYIKKKWVLPNTEGKFNAQLDTEVARAKKRGKLGRGATQAASHGAAAIVEAAEQEHEPRITSFATLTRAYGAQNNLALELRRADSMQELLQSPVFQDYFARYRHDQTLPDAIAKTVAHISENPFDSSGSRILLRSSYRLPDLDGISSQKRRRLRRFKPTAVPGVNGEIAHQTRIMYDIISVGGTPTLAIYDITIKQDVSQLGPLARQPKR